MKSLIKIYTKYCQKLDFEVSPKYSNENPKNKKLISNVMKSLIKINNLYKILPKARFRSFPLIFR